MDNLIEGTGAAQRLDPNYFGHLPSEDLVQIRHNLEAVLEDRGYQTQARPKIVVGPDTDLVLLHSDQRRVQEKLGEVLSPAQVKTYLDCSARWWFKHGLLLPEPKTSSLALGLAIHGALEVNFRQKIETSEDLGTPMMTSVFRERWSEQMGETSFRADEQPEALAKAGEQMIRKYMEEAAPSTAPAAVELEVEGRISQISVRGRVDLLDKYGCIVDFKTAARRPTSVAPDYAFQLATYSQITPGASGEARLDTLVRTQAIQLVQMSYRIGEQDLTATRTLYPLVQEGIRSGLYYPNRQSMLCGRKYCAFWKHCEREFGGTVRET